MLRTNDFLLLLTATLALTACDGDGTAGPGGGGSGGTGAAGGTGGSAGGTGGTGGATGGTGGTSTGGAGGTGGTSTGGAGGSGVPQCTDASQCQLVNDCCSCVAIGPGETTPTCEIPQCLVPTCDSIGKKDQTVQCVTGQCVAGFNCDHNTALCDSFPPDCPPGQTASVNDGCWGGCVPADECAVVGSCDQCGSLACVEEVAQAGPVRHCVVAPAACNGDPSCACMGAAVCVGLFDVCTDSPSGGLQCTCPSC